MIIRDSILYIVVFVALIIAIGLRIAKKTKSKYLMVYSLPLAVAVVHFILFGFNMGLLTVYVGVILFGLSYLLCNKKKLFVLAIVLEIILFFISLALSPILGFIGYNYASLDYAESFTKMHESIASRYALTDWKGINFDSLYEEYYPQFLEAEENKDETAYYYAWINYTAAFDDPHMRIFNLDEYLAKGRITITAVKNKLAGNSFGFSMAQIEDGSVIAILVDEDSAANMAGINNGTIITAFDGKDINKVIAEENVAWPDLSIATSENEAFYKAFFSAGREEDILSVTFINENNMEETVSLKSIGIYTDKLEQAITLFCQSEKTSENYEWKILHDQYGYITINSFLDFNAEKASNKFRTAMEEMMQAGMEDVIIDLRNNSGGLEEASLLISGYFTKEDYLLNYLTAYNADTKEYDIVSETWVYADPIGYEGQVILLINNQTYSTTEGFVDSMSSLDNVTVIGTSGTTGGYSGISFASLVSENYIIIFPTAPHRNEDGQILIDSDINRNGGILPDIEIPFDRTAIEAIFIEGRDYELDFVQEYLED